MARVYGPNARSGGPLTSRSWSAAVRWALLAGQYHGQKQRVFRNKRKRWTYTCDHCRDVMR